MLRKLLVTTFAIAFFAVFLGTETSAQTRVYFKKGSSTGTIVSTIKGNGSRRFVLGAKEGQSINARITSTKNRVIINEEEGATNITFDAQDGDNWVEIYNRSKYRTRFRIVFTIKGKKLIPPTRVNFEKGKESKIIDLQMERYKKKKRYVVRARKGQQLTVKMLTKSVAKRTSFWIQDKSRVENIVSYEGHYYCVVKETGDYIIDVTKLDEDYLEGRMEITIDEFAQ